ncbi:MAG: hypothetical protein GEV09_12660 [Pseudonocardiaceae bacterium]|nr:hypothetical protein [Pseudonocardiaceae bacterium]
MLWEAVVKDFELSPPELTILTEACHTADELGRLRVELTSAATVVLGSTGQPIVNRLFDDLRRHRELLARLLGALKVTDDGGFGGRW